MITVFIQISNWTFILTRIVIVIRKIIEYQRTNTAVSVSRITFIHNIFMSSIPKQILLDFVIRSKLLNGGENVYDGEFNFSVKFNPAKINSN